MKTLETLIIGAGPAGLAVAARMRKRKLSFTILESADRISSSWYRHYDRLHLHTVKELSHLPHSPFPEDYPRYVPREKLIQYFENYAARFDIKPLYGHEVKSIKKNDQSYIVHTSLKDFSATNVVIATGANRIPIKPSWPGQRSFLGTLIHSCQYKNATPYHGQQVLVIGMGNTGAEIALDLAESDIPVLLSVRSPVNIVPRDMNGRPTQLTARQLAKLPLGIGDWLGTQIRKLYYGNLRKYGLTPSKMHPAQQLRETGKTPVIDIGTIQKIKEGKIKIIPDIKTFTEKGILDRHNQEHNVDTVILATGYRSQLEDFLFDTEGLLDKNGFPKSPIGQGNYAGLYFCGFDNYQLGGILGTIHEDSKTIVDHLR